MFRIARDDDGRIVLSGTLDAAHAEEARAMLNGVQESCTLDCAALSYISSLGLGVLAATQKRLIQKGHGLRIVNLNDHLRNIFRIASFDQIFDID